MNNSSILEIDAYTYVAPFESSFKRMKYFFDEDILTDVVLITNGNSIKCHRAVLASACPYFEGMFTQDFKESKERFISMNEIDYDILKAIIGFLYTKPITITRNNAVDILSAACFFQIRDLISACSNFLIPRLDIENSSGIASIAYHLCLENLFKKAKYFLQHFFNHIRKTDEFQNIHQDVLKDLIASDDLNVISEKEAYDAVVTWIQLEKDRLALLPQLLELVRWPFLSHEELTEIASSSLICTNVDSYRIIREALSFKELEQNDPKRHKLSKENIRPRKSYPGIIFYVGGQASNGFKVSHIRIYDWRKNQWSVINELLDNTGHCGCLWYKGAIVRVGGVRDNFSLRNTHIYYPAGGDKGSKRLKVGQMAVSRRNLGVCCIDDVIYAIGGLSDNVLLNTVEACSVKDGKWHVKSPMNHCQGEVAVAELRGSIIAIGGSDGVRSLETCEMYDPTEDIWRNIAPLNTARHGAGAATVDGFVYVFGGFKNQECLLTCEKYVPEEDTWLKVNDMKYPRGRVSVAAIGRNVHLLGGIESNSHSERMAIYNVDDDSWKEGPSIRNCRVGGGVVTGYVYPEDMKKLQDKIITGDLIYEM